MIDLKSKKLQGNTKKRNNAGLLVLVVIVILAILAATLFLFFGKGIKKSGSGSTEPEVDVYYYDSYSSNVTAWLGGNLIRASSAGVITYGTDGSQKSIDRFVMENPAVDVSSDYALVYDISGVSVRLVDSKGNITGFTADDTITAAGVSDDGWCVIVTDEDGYKASVTVYDNEFNPVFKWYAGSSYVVDADIAPTSDLMAVACIGSEGSFINTFSFTYEDVKDTVSCGSELIYAVDFLNGARLTAYTESAAITYSSTLEEEGRMDYDGMYLQAYSGGGTNYEVSVLTESYNGNVGKIAVTDTSGEVTASLATNDRVDAISVNGDYIAVLYSDSITVYDSSLNECGGTADTLGAGGVLVLPSGTAVILSPYSGTVFKLS